MLCALNIFKSQIYAFALQAFKYYLSANFPDYIFIFLQFELGYFWKFITWTSKFFQIFDSLFELTLLFKLYTPSITTERSEKLIRMNKIKEKEAEYEYKLDYKHDLV